jgi:hypothetical protein
MAKSMKYIIIFLGVLAIGFGQFKADLQNDNIFSNQLLDNNNVASLFDPNRFSMNHSFSMSMMNMNSQSIGVASYTNNMNFTLRDNLRLKTYMTFMQPRVLSSTTANPYTQTQLYFDAVLDYNPTPNSHLRISFGNYPHYNYYNYSPFLLNRGY